MRMSELIRKKRDGEELNQAEIDFLIKGCLGGRVPDYQVTAWLMAVYFRGLTVAETVSLTKAMIASGSIINLEDIPGPKVDKHSTGGVGDKTTLIVAPLTAAAGLKIAKMAGAALGFTGGTIDKLRSIPGFNPFLDQEQFKRCLNETGLAIIGGSEHLVPADKKIYALRDVTATVESIPLIASSVMSKKLAAGADAIVLDVKVGEGAFVKTLDEARRLAKLMIELGTAMGKKVRALISNMEQPLGRAVGNSIEVIEAVQVLKGEGPEDVRRLCIELGAEMLLLGKRTEDMEAARKLLSELLDSQAGFKKLQQMVASQGGEENALTEFSLLPQSKFTCQISSTSSGYIQQLSARAIGQAAAWLGAGREKADDVVDYSAGILLHKKVGDSVQAGDSLATIYFNDEAKRAEAEMMIKNAYVVEGIPVQSPLLILDRI